MGSPLDSRTGEISRLRMVIASQESLRDSLDRKINLELSRVDCDPTVIFELETRREKVVRTIAISEKQLEALGGEKPVPSFVPPSPKEELKSKKRALEDLKDRNYREMGRAYTDGDTLLGDMLKAKIVEHDKDIKKLDVEIGKASMSSPSMPSPFTGKPKASRPRAATHRFSFGKLDGYDDKVYGINCACSLGTLCTEWMRTGAPRTMVDQYKSSAATIGGINILVPLFGQLLEGVRDTRGDFDTFGYNEWSYKLASWRTLEIVTIPGAPTIVPVTGAGGFDHFTNLINQCESVVDALPSATISKIRSSPATCEMSCHTFGDTDKMQRLIATGDLTSNTYRAMLYLRATRNICLFCYTRSEPALMADLAVPSL